ncbi:hypothetical protein EZV62_024139 [Acer yangbiense]|uniref:TCP domain-containing protein n=1 Tax=Acer yangbiense TaxID=1000413 RepID=A0A5C7H4M7_9ROSI|nr:hypothetical protein EZV62_024139 [Acer yangbiense]
MISISKEKGFQAKQEGDSNENKFSKAPSTSRQWSGFRNPRIVRVSRSFGGKDRHSKVCTIRGLRDRRIRLSVPTAIQLYDLQDRLGLSQPSKVIDWLLEVTKNDIDKLPPLQMPQGFGHQFHQHMLLSHEANASQTSLAPFFDVNSTFLKDGGFHSLLSSKEGIKINENVNGEMMSKSKYWDVDALSMRRSKGKEVERENVSEKDEDGTSTTDYTGQQAASTQRFFPVANHSSLPGLLNNGMPFNSYYHWEPSNLSLSSQYGSHDFLSQNDQNSPNTNTLPLQSSLAFPSGSHLFFCPPATVPSLFPSYSPYAESDSRQMNNHFQQHNNILPNSHTVINSQVKPFLLNVNHPGGLADSDQSHPNKDNT